MADNCLWIQIRNHPETRFLLAKELSDAWWCSNKDLASALEEWLNTRTGYGIYTDMDIISANDIEMVTEKELEKA